MLKIARARELGAALYLEKNLLLKQIAPSTNSMFLLAWSAAELLFPLCQADDVATRDNYVINYVDPKNFSRLF